MMAHLCGAQCHDAVHFDVSYSSEDLSAEAYMVQTVVPGLALAQPDVEVLTVVKLDLFDVTAAVLRMRLEEGHDASGRRLRGTIQNGVPRAAYGIYVRLRAPWEDASAS